jgi:hypothetical protein
MAIRRIPGHAVQQVPKIPGMLQLRKKARGTAQKQPPAGKKKKPRGDGTGGIIDVEA